MMDIQTIAALIQATAAIVFLVSVVYDACRRAKLREQERRDGIIGALRQLWVQSNALNIAMTSEELSGFSSERQIKFFNSELRKIGEKWSFPYKRI
jgi:hypothetical protein